MKSFILYFTIAALVISCDKGTNEKASNMPMPIEVAQPVVKEVTLTREYPGYLDADAAVAIMGRVNGTLVSKNFKAGSRVKKGDLLFVIDPTLYRNEVVQAEAALSTAKAQLQYARDNYDRMKAAYNSNAVSSIELAQAQTNMISSEAQVSNAQAALSTARTNLDYCYIKAPHNGLMTLSEYPTGSYIAGVNSPVQLGTLYKDDIMYAYFNVTDNQWLRQQQRKGEVGREEYITFALGEDRYFTRRAKMDYLSPDVMLSTGTMRVRAELKNENGFLRPGSYISVVLPYEKISDAILVNDAAIGTDQAGNFIYVATPDDIVEYRHIVTGSIVDDTMRIIQKGLQPNERYVNKAIMKVRNGMKISPYTLPLQKSHTPQ